MPHTWRTVKNSTKGGHRPRAEFMSELADALRDFETLQDQPLVLHPTVRESLGLMSGEQVVNFDALFSNPYPFLQSHGPYLCGLVSIPTSADDGVAEFTSLFILASQRQLLTIILDPPIRYAGPFGQRLINREKSHSENNIHDVGTSLLMILRDNITSLNFVLRELALDAEHIEASLRSFGQDRKRDNFESLKRIEAHLVRMRIEVESLLSVTAATADLVRSIASHQVNIDGSEQIFDRRHEITAEMLEIQAKQTIAVRDRLEGKVEALSSKCETLRDKFFVEATHRIGAVAAILLVPTFIVGLYGQNFDFPERNWFAGYGFSWAMIVASVVSLSIYFRKKRWL